MGMFLGKILVETPKYTVIKKGIKYEVREYSPGVAAEVSYDASTMRGGRDGGFMILASYIGAFGSPANKKSAPPIADSSDADTKEKEGGEEAQKIAMTAPVITKSSDSEAIAMTAPVITMEEGTEEEAGEKKKKKHLTTMQFILPAKYTMESVPKPTDERVKLREIPARTVAAITFSGVFIIVCRCYKFIGRGESMLNRHGISIEHFCKSKTPRQAHKNFILCLVVGKKIQLVPGSKPTKKVLYED